MRFFRSVTPSSKVRLANSMSRPASTSSEGSPVEQRLRSSVECPTHGRRPAKPRVVGSNPPGRASSFDDLRDNAVTTLVAALHAVERGDPYALRMAVEAMGAALDVLTDARDVSSDPDTPDAEAAREVSQ